ncbi:hypothetical protein SAMN02799630_01967 [Paenibacillus sp. UNCCL117]|uniref:hypothetical protein n=1 Tax=unclassified Paenibacillus TaxID=185978 RepID=UPI000882B8ED|nr:MULTISPECIES: hypothetical protein [unclassified Paenibacillus]SDD05550.1 hypothetical protein SAMN04488602_105162 [Paenibacillus sp. cl123]SFW31875.1 hypothetical protein SAMN02799630_01967 [Paenibacillus sp. UNCCL117]
MTKVQLSISIPPVKCWQFSAFPLAVIGPDERSWGWIYSNYIQVSIHERFATAPVPFGFYEYDYACNPLLSVQRMDRDLFPLFHRGIVDFVKDCIGQGYSVYLNLNEYHVPSRMHYGVRNYSHDVLVYGYDEEQSIFDLLGYNERLMFGSSAISFTEFEQAYASLDTFPNTCRQIFLYRLNERASYSFNIDLVVESLEDYLYSRNTALKYRLLAEPEDDLIFGLDSYPILQQFVEAQSSNTNPWVDMRYLHMLWEHKHLMVSRIAYMTKRGFLAEAGGLPGRFAQLEKTAEAARNSFIKFSRSRKPAHLTSIIGTLERMRAEERQLYDELLAAIRLRPDLSGEAAEQRGVAG